MVARFLVLVLVLGPFAYLFYVFGGWACVLVFAAFLIFTTGLSVLIESAE